MTTKGDPQFVVLKYQAWLDASHYENTILGAIVKNPLSPSSNYAFAPSDDIMSDKTEYQTGDATDFLLANDATRTKEFAASVTRVAGFQIASSNEDKEQLAGKYVRFKRIGQLDDFWETLKSKEAVSTKALKWVAQPGPYPPCLVVGIMVCEDVELSREGLRSRKISGDIQLPIEQVALPTSTTISLDEEASPKMSLDSSKHDTTAFSAKFGEKKIFALELRTVTTHWLRWRNLQLKNDGPEFDPVRLAGGGGRDAGFSNHIIIDDLILDYFNEDDVEDLIS